MIYYSSNEDPSTFIILFNEHKKINGLPTRTLMELVSISSINSFNYLIQNRVLNPVDHSWVVLRVVMDNNIDKLKILLENGFDADSNTNDADFCSALHYLIFKGERMHFIDLLLEYGADPYKITDLKTCYGPFTATCLYGHANLCKLFLDRFGPPKYEICIRALRNAFYSTDLSTFKLMLQHADPFDKIDGDDSVFMLMCKSHSIGSGFAQVLLNYEKKFDDDYKQYNYDTYVIGELKLCYKECLHPKLKKMVGEHCEFKLAKLMSNERFKMLPFPVAGGHFYAFHMLIAGYTVQQ